MYACIICALAERESAAEEMRPESSSGLRPDSWDGSPGFLSIGKSPVPITTAVSSRSTPAGGGRGDSGAGERAAPMPLVRAHGDSGAGEK